MVDVADKTSTKRTAAANSFIQMNNIVLDLIESGRHKKGDVLATARNEYSAIVFKPSNLGAWIHDLI